MATGKLYWFIRAMRDRCFEQRVLVDHWRKARKATANVVHLKGIGGRSFDRLLYVKDCAAEVGFWGINKNQIDAFDGSGLPWSLVLLLGSGLSEKGYLVTSEQVHQGIAENHWSFQESRDEFKLHEHDIPNNFKFDSLDLLINTLLNGQ